MGASLTCGTDGRDLRLLARGTSHVIWLGDDRLYLWDEIGARLRLLRDRPDGAADVPGLPEAGIDRNVHLRHLPPGAAEPAAWVWDTPYAETVRLMSMEADGAPEEVAAFDGHVPNRGPFRCDLHPCPDPSGRRLALTSLQGGGRQIHVAERT